MTILRAVNYIIVASSLFLATGVRADIVGQEPGTSADPKDNVPGNIQRSALGEAAYPQGSSGPGTRSDELVGMKKKKPEPVTEQQLEQNVEKTHGSGAAVAAEKLNDERELESEQNTQQRK